MKCYTGTFKAEAYLKAASGWSPSPSVEHTEAAATQGSA